MSPFVESSRGFFEELHRRVGAGLEVSLLWSRSAGKLIVSERKLNCSPTCRVRASLARTELKKLKKQRGMTVAKMAAPGARTSQGPRVYAKAAPVSILPQLAAGA